MKSIRMKAPATSANVGPGYDIFALTLHEPFDEFEITLTGEPGIAITIDNNSQNIPTDPNDNTAGLAAMELLRARSPETGVHIRIIKHMCSGGGLGTTGASCAAAVFGLDRLLGLNLSWNEMVDFARKGEVASGGSPHADNVAAALLGGFVLVKSYQPMDVLKLELPDFPVVLAAIKKSQRTTRGFITYEIGQEKLKEQMARCARVIHAIHTHDIEEFGKAISQDYIHEPVRGAAIPGYWETKKRIIDAGAFGCTVSGGGSSVIAFCSQELQPEIAAIMQEAFSTAPGFAQVFQTRTTNHGVREISS
ncbi:MAG: homoserine kinase [Bacteroidales bacterium]|nr:homoserine kinase [Bacteroidales bacterium]